MGLKLFFLHFLYCLASLFLLYMFFAMQSYHGLGIVILAILLLIPAIGYMVFGLNILKPNKFSNLSLLVLIAGFLLLLCLLGLNLGNGNIFIVLFIGPYLIFITYAITLTLWAIGIFLALRKIYIK